MEEIVVDSFIFHIFFCVFSFVVLCFSFGFELNSCPTNLKKKNNKQHKETMKSTYKVLD